MSVSLFNREQQDYMQYLTSITADDRCWCGWGIAGECDTPDPCAHDMTFADRQRTEQPCCGRPAARPDFPRTTGSHYAGCTPRQRDAFAIEMGIIDLGGDHG